MRVYKYIFIPQKKETKDINKIEINYSWGNDDIYPILIIIDRKGCKNRLVSFRKSCCDNYNFYLQGNTEQYKEKDKNSIFVSQDIIDIIKKHLASYNDYNTVYITTVIIPVPYIYKEECITYDTYTNKITTSSSLKAYNLYRQYIGNDGEKICSMG